MENKRKVIKTLINYVLEFPQHYKNLSNKQIDKLCDDIIKEVTNG